MRLLREERFLKTNTVADERKAAVVKVVKERLFEDPAIVFAYVYGSFAEGMPFRDVDVAIYLKPDDCASAFESDLSYELGERVGFPVDIKVINPAPSSVRMAVIRKGVLLFTRDAVELADFIEDTGRQYMDYAHFRNIYLGA